MNHTENELYDAAKGPVPSPRGGGKKTSAKQLRVPLDLGRSRRVGLRRTICSYCGAVKDQGYTRHASKCPMNIAADLPATIRFTVERTGPMKPNETSLDTGWTS